MQIYYIFAVHFNSSVEQQITLFISSVFFHLRIYIVLFWPDWHMKPRHIPDASQWFNDYQLNDSVFLVQPTNQYV